MYGANNTVKTPKNTSESLADKLEAAVSGAMQTFSQVGLVGLLALGPGCAVTGGMTAEGSATYAPQTDSTYQTQHETSYQSPRQKATSNVATVPESMYIKDYKHKPTTTGDRIPESEFTDPGFYIDKNCVSRERGEARSLKTHSMPIGAEIRYDKTDTVQGCKKPLPQYSK